MVSFRFSSLSRFGVLLLLSVGVVGCQISSSKAEMERLEAELSLLEQRITETQAALKLAQERDDEARVEAEVVNLIRGGFRSEIQWNGGVARLSGRLRNDSGMAISRIAVEATRSQGATVVARERVVVNFSPILLPAAESPFAVEASPFIWGFQEGERPGMTHFIVEEVVLPNGKTLRDDFSANRAREQDLEKLRERFSDLRMRHGTLYTELQRLRS